MSSSLALNLGKVIRGVVPMFGYIPSFVKEEYPTQPIDHISVFVTQGEFDEIFPPAIGQQSYEYFKERARSVKYAIYPETHIISENMQQDFIQWFRHDVER